jgi:hypothetical protein
LLFSCSIEEFDEYKFSEGIVVGNGEAVGACDVLNSVIPEVLVVFNVALVGRVSVGINIDEWEAEFELQLGAYALHIFAFKEPSCAVKL